MTLPIFYFVFGLTVLILSAQVFIKIATDISKILKLSPLIIGLTVVALGTSLPELSFSLVALSRNDQGLSYGNIIGSNIINLMLIFGVSLLIGEMKIGNTKTQKNLILLMGSTFAFFFVPKILPSPYAGFFLLLLGVLISFKEYFWGIRGRDGEDSAYIDDNPPKISFVSTFFQLVLSLVGLFLGSRETVLAVESLSLYSGYSTTFLGFSLAAVSTSLPELVMTLMGQKHDQGKIVLGNLIGSNIYNLLFIGGLLCIFSSPSPIPFIYWLFLILSTILFSITCFVYKDKIIPKFVGIIFFCYAILYFFLIGSFG